MSQGTSQQGPLASEVLRERERAARETFENALSLRVHRAISWLARAERESDDPDASVIFYWISFNAAYARVQDEPNADESQKVLTERGLFRDFFELVLRHDKDNLIYNEIWNRFSGPIRLLLDNRFVFQPFWDSQRTEGRKDEWQASFDNSKAASRRALARQDTLTVLSIVFDRLYVLRNQLVHGGSTWNSSVNRSQVEDGARILSFLVPLLISVMLDNPREDWGEPAYPPVEGLN